MTEQRPLDVLEGAIGQDVTVLLKGGQRFDGELVGYDQHMNLVIAPSSGETPDPGESEPALDERANDDSDDGESPDGSGGSPGSGEPTDATDGVDNTTIIRGDNVVSIEP